MEPGIAAQLSASPATALPVLFGAGVLTSLTPCVYPMIPITAAIVGGQSVAGVDVPRSSRWRPVSLTLGVCTLLVAVGVSSGAVARLPRAGVWMLWVKRLFAVAMIGAAEYYLIQAGTVWL